MKKIVLIYITFAPFLSNSQTQNEVEFKTQYLANTQYEQKIIQTSKTEVTYYGTDDFLQNLKDKGIKNPTITNTQTEIQTLSKTGKQVNGKFPLTIEFIKSTNSDGKKIIPDGTVIYGHGANDSLPVLDSIVASDMKEDFKKMLLESMKSTFSQLSISERRVKIGESYTDEKPLTIPIAGTTLDMTTKTTYTLLNCKNGIAEFDVTSVYTIKTELIDHTTKASGNSSGKLYYDIAKKNLIQYETVTAMKMSLQLEKFSLGISTNSTYSMTSKISIN